MNGRLRLLAGTGALLVVVAISGGAYVLGLDQGRASRGIRSVSASEAASAMSNDTFYSTYGSSTLIVTGSVASIGYFPGGLRVNFVTGSQFGAACDIPQPKQMPAIHTSLTLVAQADSATRESASILLERCAVP